MSSEWISVKEASEIIGISPRAVRGRIRRGRLEYKEVEETAGMVLKVRREDVEKTQRSPAGRKPQ